MIDLNDGIAKLKTDVTNIEPEVLFSMYQDTEQINKYLQFVFPRKITVNFVREQSIPTFFTFVSTDDTACSSYFHCLIYYEKIDK